MALYFPRSNALLLLVPKTGSTWIRATVNRYRINAVSVGDETFRDHDMLASFDRSKYSFIGAFVRNPIEWYRSYWAYRMERGWRPQYSIDRICASDNFETFVRKAVSTMPGALTKIFASYTGTSEQPIDFIGKQETLEHDFSRFLSLIGEPTPCGSTGQQELINRTTTRPEYSDELKELIVFSEWEALERHGYLASSPDPVDLAGLRARYPDHAQDLRLLCLWTEKIHWEPDDKKRARGVPVKASTRHARIHSNFALFTQFKLNDTAAADYHFQRALALDPRHPRTLCNYALFHWQHKKDPAAARELMLRALTHRPNHPYTLGRLARLTYKAYGDRPLAEVFFRQSLNANPKQSEIQMEFADFLAESGAIEEARALYEAVVHERPTDAIALARYALFLGTLANSPVDALAVLQPHMEKSHVERVLALAHDTIRRSSATLCGASQSMPLPCATH